MARGNWATRALPPDGAVRVSADPVSLPALTGGNRYDDPDGLYRVRYLGGTLECCLKEIFDRGGRASRTFEATAATYAPGASAAGGPETDPDEDDDSLDDYPMPPGADPSLSDVQGWLSNLKVARLSLRRAEPIPVVDDDSVLDDVVAHPRVRQVMEAFQHALGHLSPRQIVRSTHEAAYRVTQAVSAVVHHDDEAFGGLAYASCVDAVEECWGIYDRTPVATDRPVPLLHPAHAPAIAAAAAFVGVDVSRLVF